MAGTEKPAATAGPTGGRYPERQKVWVCDLVPRWTNKQVVVRGFVSGIGKASPGDEAVTHIFVDDGSGSVRVRLLGRGMTPEAAAALVSEPVEVEGVVRDTIIGARGPPVERVWISATRVERQMAVDLFPGRL